jgi:hypothetical protein
MHTKRLPEQMQVRIPEVDYSILHTDLVAEW